MVDRSQLLLQNSLIWNSVTWYNNHLDIWNLIWDRAQSLYTFLSPSTQTRASISTFVRPQMDFFCPQMDLFEANNCVKSCHFQIRLEIHRISWHWNYKSTSDWNSDQKINSCIPDQNSDWNSWRILKSSDKFPSKTSHQYSDQNYWRIP